MLAAMSLAWSWLLFSIARTITPTTGSRRRASFQDWGALFIGRSTPCLPLQAPANQLQNAPDIDTRNDIIRHDAHSDSESFFDEADRVRFPPETIGEYVNGVFAPS
jgi:hypothetical protein